MVDKPDASTDRNAGGLTAEDIVMAYRLLLDREPESAEVVARHIARSGNLKALRAAMLNSQEFRAKFAQTPAVAAGKPLTWPAIKVDVGVSAAQLAEMVRLVEGNWEVLGRSEPHWSVLTRDQFRSENIRENEEDFYRGGKYSLDVMTSAAARCGLDIASLNTCLELGCGVGRVTVWLAKQFASVIGVDISRPHLLLAEAAAQQHAVSNIRFAHINSLQSLRDLPNFDCFYSVIVLQHNPPPVIYAIIDALLPKLNPGGIAYFQVPTYSVGYQFNADSYLASAKIRGVMEMHLLPQPVLFSLYSKHNCRALEVREDGKAGSAHTISNSFLIQKHT